MRKLKRIVAYHMNRRRLRKALLAQTKKDKNIIYGAQSINKQAGVFSRGTEDYDILSKNPKKAAKKTEKKFDKIVGSNQFYVKPAMHPGTFKVMHVGIDMRAKTKDDKGLVDYSKIPKPKPPVKVINGIAYRSLTQEAVAKQKSLRDKQMAFRHKKDRGDLRSIRAAQRFKRGLKRK